MNPAAEFGKAELPAVGEMRKDTMAWWRNPVSQKGTSDSPGFSAGFFNFCVRGTEPRETDNRLT